MFLFLYALFSLVEGYPNGAGTCDVASDFSTITSAMDPGGYPRNLGPGTFTITANVTNYNPSQPILITLGTPSYTIFGVQLTPYQGSSTTHATGTWTISNSILQVNPLSGCGATITHNNIVSSQSINAVFTPGGGSSGFFWSTGTPSITPGVANFTVRVGMAMPGTAYYVFLLHGSPPPSVAQVIAGEDSNNITQPSGSISCSTANTVYTTVVSLGPATSYDGYFVGQYSVGNQPILFTAYVLISTDNFYRLTSGSGALSIPPQIAIVQSAIVNLTGTTFTNVPLKPQNITFNPISSATYGDAPATLSATASSGFTVTFISSNASICSVSGNTVTFTGAGTATITAQQSGGGNYSAAPDVSQPCVVARASQTIMVSNPPYDLLIQGGTVKMVGFTSSVWLPLTYTLMATNLATIKGDVVTALAPGMIEVIISSDGGANWIPVSTNYSFTIVAQQPIPAGATQVFLQIRGLSIWNASKDLAVTEQDLQTILSTTLGIPPSRVNLTIVQALISDPNNSVEITFNILPSTNAGDPTSMQLYTNLQTAAANSSSSFSQVLASMGWSTIKVTTTLPYSIQFQGQTLYFEKKGSGLPDSFEAYWTITGSTILMAVRAQHDGWVGWGFSPGSPQMIGSDATVGWDGQTYSSINDYHLVDKTTGASLSQGGQQGLQLAEVEYSSGMTTILFQRNLVANKTTIHTTGDTSVVFALGALPPQYQSLAQHTDQYNGYLNFDTGDYQNAVSALKQAHASLMWLGFGLFLPFGICAARFLKPYHPPLWFNLHRGFQMTGLALLFAGFIIGAASIGSHTQTTHMGFGYTAISLAILQPFIAVIRPHPPEKGEAPSTPRQVWFGTHALVGYSAVILAMINMLIGITILGSASVYVALLVVSIIIWAAVWGIGSVIKCLKRDTYVTPKEVAMAS